jgi:hypothetical protein
MQGCSRILFCGIIDKLVDQEAAVSGSVNHNKEEYEF